MSIKNVLRTMGSVFVVLPEQPPDPSQPGKSDGNSVPQLISPNLVSSRPAAAAPGTVDLAEIYRQAGLPAVPLSAERIRDMLARSPADLSAATKRQMMLEMLNTLGTPVGATIDSIIADATSKISALNNHIATAKADADRLIADAQSEIANLKKEIEEKRQEADRARREQEDTDRECRAEVKRLNDVLDFLRFPR